MIDGLTCISTVTPVRFEIPGLAASRSSKLNQCWQIFGSSLRSFCCTTIFSCWSITHT
jgi:hypothetical protein